MAEAADVSPVDLHSAARGRDILKAFPNKAKEAHGCGMVAGVGLFGCCGGRAVIRIHCSDAVAAGPPYLTIIAPWDGGLVLKQPQPYSSHPPTHSEYK